MASASCGEEAMAKAPWSMQGGRYEDEGRRGVEERWREREGGVRCDRSE
jgi:hypothetical protein